MNGNRLLLDTNAIVALLRGNSRLLELTQSARWIGISIISQLEFFCFSKLSKEDEFLFQQFAARMEVIGIDPQQPDLIAQIIDIRRKFRHKLPDAVIAATAILHHATLVSADLDFSKIDGLTVESW